MKNNKRPFHFSEIITEDELNQWEAEYERAKELYYKAKEERTDEELKI